MATYYWRGGTGAPTHLTVPGLGSTGMAGIEYRSKYKDSTSGGPWNSGISYGSSNIGNFSWNTPGNWMIKRMGSTGNQVGTSGGASGGGNGNTGHAPGYWYETTQSVPGGGDIARFVYHENQYSPYQTGSTFAPPQEDNTDGPYGSTYGHGEFRIPQAPCLIGGFWNDGRPGGGWSNAGNTVGNCQIIIEESFGDQPVYNRSTPEAPYDVLSQNGLMNLIGANDGMMHWLSDDSIRWVANTSNYGCGLTFPGGISFGNVAAGTTFGIAGLRVKCTTFRDMSKGIMPAYSTLLKSDITSIAYRPKREGYTTTDPHSNSLPPDFSQNQYFGSRRLHDAQILCVEGGTLDQVSINVEPDSGPVGIKINEYNDENWQTIVSARRTQPAAITNLLNVVSLSGPDEVGTVTGNSKDPKDRWYNYQRIGGGIVGQGTLSSLDIRTDSTIPYIYYNVPYRGPQDSVWASQIENLIVSPEKPRIKTSEGTGTSNQTGDEQFAGCYTPLYVGSGSGRTADGTAVDGCTVDIIEMRDSGGYEDESWSVLGAGIIDTNQAGIRGVNNTVSVDFSSGLDNGNKCTIKDLKLKGGNFILGVWDNMGRPRGSESGSTFAGGLYGVVGHDREAEFNDNNTLLIEKGFLNEKAFFDGRCWDTPAWAGLKIGPGVSHASDPARIGLEINSSNAELILPQEIRLVAAYINQGQAGVTVDPVLVGDSIGQGPKFASRTNP
tara:strand:- start:18280 stop:20439 length:2160 start_codon:yes stop_codon:yes gene_type:complete